MIGFFKLLLGMINLSELCWILYERPDYLTTKHEQEVVYGICKQNIDDNSWNVLVNILKTDTFKNLLNEFLDTFCFPDELRDLMIDLYGINKIKAYSFNIDIKKVKLNFCYEIINLSNGETYLKLVRVDMPELCYYVLDPCITMLLSTYYQALLHYISFPQKYHSSEINYFHNTESCSPWIEELFCLAFKDVLGDLENIYSCRTSERRFADRISPVPAFVLETVKKMAEGETINDAIKLDKSIICKNANSSDFKNGAKEHLYAWRNRISPYSQNIPEVCHESNLVYIDSLYGYSYDYELITNNTTIYGATNSVPTPLEWLLNSYSHDWLRIPFIKVPRFKVKSAEELYGILKNLYRFNVLFRGQTSGYYLKRSLPLMKKMYDDEGALEPSLASYAVRTNVIFENYYIEWSAIIKAYLYNILGVNSANEFLDKLDDFNYYLFCLSIAQHYGLPTYGLDVTASISTALFFAFYKFTEIDAKTRKYTYKKKEQGESIIYVFRPTEGEYFDYSRFNLYFNIFPRPLMQKASFAHCSWGYAKNAIAERLIAAIQFDVSMIDFEMINSLLRSDFQPELYEKNFFSYNDYFISFLHNYITDTSDTYNKEFKNYLKTYIYQI